MQLFAIQRISDGKYLPAPPIHYKGGQTSMEFDFSKNQGQDQLEWINHPDRLVPRLFRSYRGANVCLKLWLKGALEKKYNYGPTQISKDRSRSHLDPNDYAVVPVAITVRETLEDHVHHRCDEQSKAMSVLD